MEYWRRYCVVILYVGVQNDSKRAGMGIVTTIVYTIEAKTLGVKVKLFNWASP